MAFLPSFGFIRKLADESLVIGIAEIGVILLMFKTGMESNLEEMKSVRIRATAVTLIGFILPFVGGYFASKLLMPGYPSAA